MRFTPDLGAVFGCDAFDAAARLCTAHDDRPDVCRRFPWYDDDPADYKLTGAMGPVCSYVADIPGRLLPIVAINGATPTR